MTIGIAVCLTDGALLIADGRRTKPFTRDAVVGNNVDKIHRIARTIGVVSFGIELVTKEALKNIRASQVDLTKLSPQDVAIRLDSAVDQAWRSFLERLSGNVDRKHPCLRAGFLVGGVAGKTNFVAGVLFSPRTHDVPTVVTEAYKYILLGGEEANSQCIFAACYTELIEEIEKEAVDKKEIDVLSFVGAGVSTIREVEKIDPTIGGTIRYVTILRDRPYCVVVA